MLNTSKKMSALVYAIFIVLVLATAAASFEQQLRLLRTEIESTFHSRSELLSKFVDLHRDRVSVMRNLLVQHYQSGAVAPGTLKFQAYPAQNLWASLSSPLQMAGTFSGSGKLQGDQARLKEVRAALAMDVQIYATLEYDKDVTWMYYLSAGNFIYIAPAVDIGQFHFSPELYRRRYWLEALPAANPAQRMILAGPDQDMAGTGSILTFAYPVTVNGRFLGVVALDLNIKTLQSLTGVGDATGVSMLLSENDRVIARQDGKQSEAAQRLQRPPDSNSLIGWREDPRGDLWLCSPVVKDELWLVHRVVRSELYWVAVRKSAGTWLMIVLFSALSLVTWRLQGALKEVIRMTHIDPLTQALNRRGFYEQSVNTFAVGKRENLLPAMMIMDIDFFKKVNDTYGHATGDSVLKQLGNYVLKASRPYDLVCRWGGEEFVLLMLVKDGAEAAVVAERMRQEAQRTRIQPGDVPVTLSGGLVLMRPNEALDEAVRRADELLYQAKQGGRNRIVQDLQR